MAGRRAAGLDALWSQCTESLTPSPILSDGSGREKQLAVLLRPERLGRCLFGDYAQEWLAQRTDLRPLSRDQYASLIANHLGPAFGDMELARVSAGQVRSWYALTSARTPGAATSAYRLLWAIFNTAVTDQMVARTPCRIRGAGATARRSARYRPSPRSRPSCGQCRPSCEPPSCWQRGAPSAGARCWGYGGTTSTWPPARSRSSGRWGSGATVPSSWARRSRVLA